MGRHVPLTQLEATSVSQLEGSCPLFWAGLTFLADRLQHELKHELNSVYTFENSGACIYLTSYK